MSKLTRPGIIRLSKQYRFPTRSATG